MLKRYDCQARQYGDQMICAKCGLTWDTNDPEPPECRKHEGRAKVAQIIAEFDTKPKTAKVLPHELPSGIALHMARAFYANVGDGNTDGRIRAMQAAYRLFLDMVEL